MPTDAAKDKDTSAFVRDERKGARLAIGVAGVFILGMLFQWPFAFLGAVFASMFLQGPTAPSLGAGLKLVLTAFFMLLFGYGLFSVLLPYRPTFMIAQVLMVMWAFSLSVSGKSPLLVILALMEAVMMPFLVHLSLDIGLIFAFALPFNMATALLATWAAFGLFPPRGAAPQSAVLTKPAANFDPTRRLLRMTFVTAPFVILFFMLDGGAVITLVFVGILSFQLAASTSEGPKVAKALLLANLIGGLVAWVAYQLIVINTQFVFMATIVLLLCFILSNWFISGKPSAPLAATVLSASLILLGGTMAPFGDDVDIKMLDRLLQLGGALAWVLLSFVTVDHLLPERKRPPESTPSPDDETRQAA
ncbi:hypothetical protein [Shimia abyssi]|uniref:DUF2955 domain-containing protein n=1 Tax=Shimia abyssi TaxID=1662395 RepID=A0A2P8FEC4_9RHOB|nr:hypothetical protein [Shimia abyssi]PSL20071.1 hypothetical protein CLV88_104131 [Shimia abyssi]